MVGGVLAGIEHVASAEVHVPRVVVAVLSGRPVVVRLGGGPGGKKQYLHTFNLQKSDDRFEGFSEA